MSFPCMRRLASIIISASPIFLIYPRPLYTHSSPNWGVLFVFCFCSCLFFFNSSAPIRKAVHMAEACFLEHTNCGWCTGQQVFSLSEPQCQYQGPFSVLIQFLWKPTSSLWPGQMASEHNCRVLQEGVDCAFYEASAYDAVSRGSALSRTPPVPEVL